MEIGKQIQKYRAAKRISQEELADRIYVTRQTLSNWETGKTYPDINSLLRLSDLFHISLDELVKGDIQAMEEKIKQEDIARFRQENNRLKLMLVLCGVSFLVWLLVNQSLGEVLCLLSMGAVFLYGYRVDKLQQEFDILTYKEVKAFLEGKRLDELEVKTERKKHSTNTKELIVIIAIIGILAAIIVPRFIP